MLCNKQMYRLAYQIQGKRPAQMLKELRAALERRLAVWSPAKQGGKTCRLPDGTVLVIF